MYPAPHRYPIHFRVNKLWIQSVIGLEDYFLHAEIHFNFFLPVFLFRESLFTLLIFLPTFLVKKYRTVHCALIRAQTFSI